MDPVTGDRRPDQLPSLTGLRFVAVFTVFAFHFSHEFLFQDAAVGFVYLILVGLTGPVAVSVFFVLSGFVLQWSARPGEPTRAFWRRRAVRIYPLHAVTWLAALLLMLWAGREVFAPAALANLLLVQPWVPEQRFFFSMNDVSWSLACEAFFYLAFPFLSRAIARIRPHLLWRWVFATAGTIICVPGLAIAFLPDEPQLLNMGLVQLWAVYLFPLTRCLEFVLGILMARIVREGRWIRLGTGRATLVLAVGYLVTLVVPQLWSFAAVCPLPVGLLVAALAAADIRGERSRLSGRIMIRLGEASFAFYLVHRLVLIYGHHAVGPGSTWSTPVVVGMFVLAFVITLLGALLLHVLVEKPMMRRFSRPSRSAEADPEDDRSIGQGRPA